MGGAAALLGTVLQTRPVLYIPRGTVEVFARSRTRPRAIQLILEQVAREPQDQPLHAAIAHADALQEAEDLQLLSCCLSFLIRDARRLGRRPLGFHTSYDRQSRSDATPQAVRVTALIAS